MAKIIDYKEDFLKELGLITGIDESKIKEYAKYNNPLNILERPMVIELNEEQLEKVIALNKFVGNYNLVKKFGVDEAISITSSTTAGEYFINLLGSKKDKEVFMATFLDVKNQIIESKILTEGTIDQSPIYPREILKQALGCDCSAIIFAHNHPSGVTKASREDNRITQKLVNIFKPLGIKVLDHIIVGNRNYYSMAEHGTIPEITGIANYDEIRLDSIGKENKYEEEFELEI
ncbi:JAB domain-containing protein [Sporanaerobacter acetigenes]|uniref:DNA repair protein RadC n=1 Tax=Sporanaerobacter acetigenes DSM 13106 TaxID=1123281 RepID=A0A1M5UB07_9FIRM|nr:JAB domain-containing protein [Sporanaerobacter acetigenes]SHH60036.1 DNA repair protein RadC [Sporanaerobacter acetigenes DSM 13106]